ncbi:hypothetical protein RZN22_04460 [Bacillaceae bacterium S4-13-58]
MKDEFAYMEKDRANLGELYLQTNSQFGDEVGITFLDQRNLLSILFYFFHQVKKKKIGLISALKNIFFHLKLNAVFINGKYLKNLENYDTLILEEIKQGEMS